MHNKRQGQTRRGKRRGLTPQQAHSRTLKGWVTKHQRYTYGAHYAGDPGPHLERLAALKQLYAKRGSVPKDEFWQTQSPAEIDALYKAEFEHRGRPKAQVYDESIATGTSIPHEGSPPDQTMAAVRAKMVEELEHYRQYHEFKDPEFRNFMRSQPADVQAKFAARYRRVKDLEQRRQRVYTENFDPRDPNKKKILDPADAEYIQAKASDDVQAQILLGINHLINNNPRKKTDWIKVTDLHVEDLPKGVLNIPQADAMEHAARYRARREMNEVVDQAFGYTTRGEFRANRPQEGSNANIGGPQFERLLDKAEKTDPNLRDQLKVQIWLSHTAKTPQARRDAQLRAQTILKRASVYAANEHDKRQAVHEIRNLAADFAPPSSGSGAGSGRHPLINTDPVPLDPRLIPVRNVDELYAQSGHLERGGMLAQVHFLRQQRQRRLAGIKEGNVTLGLRNGKVTGLTTGNDKKVSWGVAPNKDWEYELRDLHKDPESGERMPNYTKRVEWYDKKTKFKEGKRTSSVIYRRDEKGRLMKSPVTGGPIPLHDPGRPTGLAGRLMDPENDPDELVRAQAVRKYKTPVAYERGDFEPRYRYEKPEGIDQVVFVPLRGSHGQTQTENHPKEKKAVYTSRNADGSTDFVTKDEYEGLVNEWKRYQGLREGGVKGLSRPAEPVRHYVPKKVQYVFQDPSNLQQKVNSAEQVSFNTGKRRVFANLEEGTTRDNVLGPYLRERDQHQLQERLNHAATTQAEWEATHDRSGVTLDEAAKARGYSGEKELKVLAKAATSAGVYSARRQLAQGYIPDTFNKTFNHLRNVGPIKKYGSKHNIVWDEELLTVNHAYIRPMQERVANLGFMARHPLSSPTGKAFGLDYGSVKNREYWINADKRASNRFGRFSGEINRVARSRSYVRQHAEDRGVVGSIRNWRSEPMMRHADYKGWDRKQGFFADRIDIARQYVNQDSVDYRDPVTGFRVQEDVTDAMRNSASDFIKKSFKTYRGEQGSIPARHDHHPVAETLADMNWSGISKSHVTWGVAAGAVALGGAYAWHRHQEGKKPVEERRSFYNKALPPSFTVKAPHVRATRWYKTGNSDNLDLFGFANRKIPVAFGASIQDHRIALRPEDHGYPQKIGLSQIRSGKVKGGSLKKSLVFENHDFKRTYRQGTHEVRVGGRKLPGTLTMDQGWRKVKKTSTNPHRLTQKDREDIVWAFAGTPQEHAVREFFRNNPAPDRIEDMFRDPDTVRQIRRRRGETEVEALGKRPPSYVGVATSDEGAAGGFASNIGRPEQPQRGDYTSAFRVGAQDFEASGTPNTALGRMLSSNRFPGEDPETRGRRPRNTR